MAERLTKKINKTIQDKYSLGSYLYYDFNGAENTNRLLNKLGELEDILEKYGIESVEELGYLLEVFKKMRKQYGKLNQENCKNKQDRDTWKKACELACDAMTKLGGDDCCGCRLNKEMCKICENKKGLIDYFYQQAKKEKEEQNNDTNQ